MACIENKNYKLSLQSSMESDLKNPSISIQPPKLSDSFGDSNANLAKVEQTLNGQKILQGQEIQVETKPKTRRRRYCRKGHWSLEQNAKYYLFLRSHLIHFKSSQLRRLQKIFKEMSNNIGTRTANQCRSHHQKQQKKHEKLDILMTNLYQITKIHPLLANEPPFSKQDSQYQGLFDQTPQQQQVQQERQNEQRECVFIVYEMPVFLQPISYQQYTLLFSQNKLI